MGFLMGAFGKIMAGKRYRQLQYEMTRVQSRLNRCTRQIQQMERMFSYRERNMKAMLQSQQEALINNYLAKNYNGTNLAELQQMQIAAMKEMKDNPSASSSMTGNPMYQYSTMISMGQQYAQMYISTVQTQYQNAFDMEKDAVLQALKDEEDSLAAEKDSLETQVQLAKQEYEAYKQEEKDGAKSFVPEFTGGN